jgi:DNA-binding Lrp family transcriptional regulator
MPEIEFSSLDQRLIHALQVAPRATWAGLAPVVGADPTTLARRWNALVDEGIAWSTGYRMDVAVDRMAVVEIDIHPGQFPQVKALLCGLPQAVTVDITASGSSAVVTVCESDRSSLIEFLLSGLPGLPNVRDIRNHLLTARLRSADQWTLRALDQDEIDRIPKERPPRARAPLVIDPRLESCIIEELGRDGRTPQAAIASAAGVSPQRVQDAIAVLLHRQRFRLRTDVVSVYSGWPAHVWYFVDVPAGQLRELSNSLAHLPEIRFAATSAGSHNLVFDVWLRSLSAVHQLEARIQSMLRASMSVRRQVVLRTPKRLGHFFDDSERHTGEYIPMIQ